MLIRVMRFRGRTPDIQTEARFQQSGGTIGRSPQCTLALPDPDRHISRIQAEVSFSGGQFQLIERGSAGHMQCNGEELQPGRGVALQDGDELHVGDYVLRVEMPSSARPAGQDLDPFADLLPPPSPAAGPGEGHPFAPGPPASGSLIPDDFDPFGKSCLVPGLSNEDPTNTRRSGSPARQEDSLDQLFGLNEAMGDPRDIGRGSNAGQGQPNTASAADPFEALQGRGKAAPAPMPDYAPEIRSPMRLPQAHAPRDAFLSWETPEGSGSSAIAGPGAGARTQRNPELPDVAATARLSPAAEPPGPVSGNELTRAFLAGAGLRELPQSMADAAHGPRQLDPQTVERIGALLQLFTQGAIDLLASRATLKAEMRSEVTMIQPQGNNPLKFSPDATVALASLLASGTPRGFMAPETAVQDAMHDIVAHQVAVIAGMRAALQGLLARFQPAELEARLSGRSMLQAVLPGSRKARLWEQFENAYMEVSKEAEEDFENLFSREFVKAYEAQIHTLSERDARATSAKSANKPRSTKGPKR